MKIQRLSNIDNFSHPDIIQILDDDGYIIKEFIANEDLVANEKLAQKFISESET